MTENTRDTPAAPGRQAIRIDVASDFAAIESLWRGGGDDLAGYVFQSYEWLSLWQATAGITEHTRPLLVRVSDQADRTLLLLPLGIMRRRGVRILVFLGGRTSDYNAPIIDPMFAEACDAAHFIALWKQILAKLPAVDVIWFKRMPEMIETVRNPMITMPGSIHTENANFAASLPETFEGFKADRKTRAFRDSIRKRKNLAALGPVTFDVIDSPKEILETVELLFAQKRRRNQETRSLPFTAAYRAFYRQLMMMPIQNGRPHVSRIKVGDAVVATHVGALHNGRYYWLLPGYEAGQWARYSVGKLLLEENIKWCISNKAAIFDMTVGDEPYKMQWADSVLKLYTSRYPVTAIGRIALLLVRKTEQARQNAWLRKWLRPLKRRLTPLPARTPVES